MDLLTLFGIIGGIATIVMVGIAIRQNRIQFQLANDLSKLRLNHEEARLGFEREKYRNEAEDRDKLRRFREREYLRFRDIAEE